MSIDRVVLAFAGAKSELRQRHIKWITNAKITRVEDGSMAVTEHDDDGKPRKEHTLPFTDAMVLPAFKGGGSRGGGVGTLQPARLRARR